MTSFLLFMSFIIHIVTFLCIYLLFKQIKRKNNSDPNEIIEIFDHYLEEIRLENEQLKNEFKSVSNRTINENEKVHLQTEPYHVSEGEEEITIPVAKRDNDDQMTASLESQVLHLYKQGKQIDEIAKQLNCGKTEASLIIQLYGRNKVNA